MTATLPHRTAPPLTDARAAIARRDFERAQDLLVEHLRAHPDDPQGLAEYGLLGMYCGRPDRARWALPKAIACGDAPVAWHLSLGYAFLAGGDPGAAQEAFTQALACQPSEPAAHHGLAICHQRAGDQTAAAALAEALAGAGQGPDTFPILIQLIDALRESGQLELARQRCTQALRMAPAAPAAWYASARVQLAAGDPAGAMALLDRCLLDTPGEARIVLEKARCLRALGENVTALNALATIAATAPEAAAANAERGHCLVATGASADAERCWLMAIAQWLAQGDLGAARNLLDRLLQENPASAAGWLARGRLASASGKPADAEAAWRRAMALDPARMDAAASLALLLEGHNRLEEAAQVVAAAQPAIGDGAPREGTAELLLVQSRLARRAKDFAHAHAALDRLAACRPDDRQRRHAAFERGKLADGAGDADAAMAAFRDGNRLAQAPWTHQHPGRNKALAGAEFMVSQVGSDWLQRLPALALPAHRPLAFLLGFPRSGTTLLNQVLDAHPDIRAIEEKPTVQAILAAMQGMPQGYPHALAGLDVRDVDWLRRVYARAATAHGDVDPNRLLLDKFPMNTLLAGLIHRVFPQARFVFALRHPCDVVLSCFMQDFELNNTMANFCSLDAAVAMYTRTMELWQRYREQLPLCVHTIRYEDVVDDFDGQVGALCGFLAVPWRQDLRDFASRARARGRIDTPSYEQVSQPLYRQARYRWQRYRSYLQPLLPALQPWIDRFGYADAQ